ncbi:MAG: hypothetical protein GX174_08765 [Lentisphaerae bacterium]|jgi:hypothetical protein|nr:hypothetical protein [Lentisphaerota bacterium]
MSEPFRQRFLVALATLTVAGGLIWWGVHPVTRLCGLVLLIVAGVGLVLAVRDLRRHRRHSRTYLRHFTVAYAPHFAVAILLAALLRAWILFAPPEPSPLLAVEGTSLQERIRADTARLLAATNDSAEARQLCHELAQTYQTFFQIDTVAHAQVHADAFLLSYAALLRETGWRLATDGGGGIGRPARVRLAASAAYLPLIRANSPDNPLLPLIDETRRQIPERRPPRYPLHALRRYALPE